jgi:hypothetical protein
MSESLVPPVLNPASLYKDEAKRDATRIRIYNSILSQIYTKIKASAKIVGNPKALWYVMPEFIPGTPRFDMGDAILYVVWNLRNTGYKVQYTHPNLLLISWQDYDERYRTTESPWSQVLYTAREQVLSGATTPTTFSHVLKPQSASKPAPEIVKRKTALKKTVEFKPSSPDPVRSTNPSIVTAMISGAGDQKQSHTPLSGWSIGTSTPAPPPSASRLPGQLSEKHVSFV